MGLERPQKAVRRISLCPSLGPPRRSRYNENMANSSPFQTILKLSSPGGRPGSMKQASPRNLVFFLHRNREDRFTLILQDEEGTPRSPHTIPADPRQEEILSLLRSIKGNSDSWIREETLFLDEHPVLTERLVRSGLPLKVEVFDNPVVFADEMIHPVYRVSLSNRGKGNEEKWTGRLEMEDGIIPLSPDYLLCSRGIRPSPSLGGRYNHLIDLEGEIAAEELESCLSLFSSLFPRIGIEVEGFHNDIEGGREISAEAEEGLLFEALPEEGALCVARTWSYDPFPIEFINNHRPAHLIVLDREEKRLRRLQLTYGKEASSSGPWEALKKILKKDCREMGLEDGWVTEESDGQERLFLSPDLALPFLDRRIGRLAGDFRLFGTESVKTLKLRTMQPRLCLNLKDGIDYFEGSALLSFPGVPSASPGGAAAAGGTDETIEMQQALSLFEKHNYIPLSDGSRALMNPRYFRTLRRLLETRGGTKGVVRVSLFDLPLLEELIDARVKGKGKQRLREVFEGFSQIEEKSLTTALPLKGSLRPYQQTGLKWMSYLQEKELGAAWPTIWVWERRSRPSPF